MRTLLTALVVTVIPVVGACSPSARDRFNKDGSAQAATAPRKASMLHPVQSADVDLDQLSGGVFTPGARVMGVDDTVSIALPGPAPGKILHVTRDGQHTVFEGRLVSDAPLRFVPDVAGVRALSFDGKISYLAHERVTAAVPWSAEVPVATSACCGWWEHTLWRAAPRAIDAGLLRVVTPVSQAWSVLDFHQPGSAEPRWRAVLTEGQGAAVAAAIAPHAEQIAVVVASANRSASLQRRNPRDGTVLGATPIGSQVAEWRRGEGRVVYSHDGARIAVLVEDPQHCETCSAIEIFDAARGERLQRVALEAVIAPRYASIGLDDDTAWVFEYIPRASHDLATRPERCQYEVQDLTSHKRRPASPDDLGLTGCRIWAMAPRFDNPGVLALGRHAHGLAWFAADTAP